MIAKLLQSHVLQHIGQEDWVACTQQLVTQMMGRLAISDYFFPDMRDVKKSPQCYNERLGTRSRTLDRGIVRSLCSHIQLFDQQQARGISWTDVLQVVAFVGLALLAAIDVKLIK